MNRRVLIYVLVAVLVLAGAGGTALYLLRGGDNSGAQKTAAEAFGRAWAGGNLGTIGWAGGQAGTTDDPAQAVQTTTAGLTSEKTDKPSDVTVGKVTESASGDTATAPLHVTWTLARDRTWEYDTTLTLVNQDDSWLPQYVSTLVHPDLTGDLATATLKASTVTGKRGQILGANDKVLVEDRPVVVVGIHKAKTDDVEQTVTRVAGVVGVDGAALLKRVKAAGADTFVDVITLRRAAYNQVSARLKPIPGVVFQTKDVALTPSSDFARPLFGNVGAATADIVKESDGRVQAGDETGLSGLQRTYDEQLAGTPGVVVTAVPKEGEGKEMFRADATDGKDLQLTLDLEIQNAADKAIATATHLAGMVAIDAKTGNILAIANGGPNGNGYNRALLGQYAPGSTFKIASGLGLVEYGGMTANKTVACPKALTVSGKKFTNAEDEVLGKVPFSSDFAHSCNTAFVGSAKLISQAQLAEAAGSLGYGQPNATGVTAFTGQVPTKGDTVAHAAAMIGQGTVLVSPMAVASASGAIASGTWHAPKLVLNGTGNDEATADVDPVKLDTKSARTMRSLMRTVVTSGTGTGMKNVPGGPVSGKTGTAEYGTDTPPKTNAWFTGFQGDIAFAVLVEDGGFGAKSAVPVAKKFLTDLAS
ncbi:penicillin-binding transpeptidase domain-containing protein [Kineosporia sp. NBRC 101731]|uniref:penicillin-binding transpeptidase domain-containing protein n=1 Tax=Kineosporia sp. NBRC 101731 TaxID=3032199 RepID=UPI0024A35A4C|nr:penicillin-binding transpeptidase domain-containing protein [Kineosporia sp. NBRC 101731]GLY33322.1 cell division protein FtsI [Kineosporia sp. NBRC 101731]